MDITEIQARQALVRSRIPGAECVCDAYQPLEARYRLTRACVSLLREHHWEVKILTRSPLVLRDLDLLGPSGLRPAARVGLSIGSDDDDVRRALEPHVPPIQKRVDALRQLKQAGVRTWAFIDPLLPMDPARLFALLDPWVDEVLIDHLNYSSSFHQRFQRQGLAHALQPAFADDLTQDLLRLFGPRARRVDGPPAS